MPTDIIKTIQQNLLNNHFGSQTALRWDAVEELWFPDLKKLSGED